MKTKNKMAYMLMTGIQILYVSLMISCGTDQKAADDSYCSEKLYYTAPSDRGTGEVSLDYSAKVNACRDFVAGHSSRIFLRLTASGVKTVGYISGIEIGAGRTLNYHVNEHPLVAESMQFDQYFDKLDNNMTIWNLPWSDVAEGVVEMHVSVVSSSKTDPANYPRMITIEVRKDTANPY
jgi:hypothetical protein